jgi:predicted DNA-binding transcriptional regulator YafY
MNFVDTGWARFFATLGPEATVLAPPELRERLRALAKNLFEQYLER